MGTKVPARTKAKLNTAATEHMPERIKSFFQDPRVKYAA